MEDTGGSSGHPQAADVSSSVGVTGIGKLWETRLRGGGKGAPLQGGGGGGGEGVAQSRRYSEQRGFSLCHIRTVGCVWKAARQLSALHLKSCLGEHPKAPLLNMVQWQHHSLNKQNCFFTCSSCGDRLIACG